VSSSHSMLNTLIVFLLPTCAWTASVEDPLADLEGCSFIQQSARLLDKHDQNKGNLSRITSLAWHNAEGVLYYHVHIPKTGGTTLSNIIVSSLCGNDNDAVQTSQWKQHCSVQCAHAMVDTEASCMDEWRSQIEHGKFNHISDRVDVLKKQYPIREVVYITTLRPGAKRMISQWAHEVNSLKTWSPPPDVPPMSNESLLLYLAGQNWTNNWPGVEEDSVSQRNNFQVASLAAVPGDMEVTAEHLEQAKDKLRTGKWIIGFTECLPQLHHKLWTLTASSGSAYNSTLPELAHESPRYLSFSNQVMDELRTRSRFDNELYEWAWQRSPAGLKCTLRE